MKRKLVALLLLSNRCIVTINVLWLFLTAPWIGLQCVIVVFPDLAHLLFGLALLGSKPLRLVFLAVKSFISNRVNYS